MNKRPLTVPFSDFKYLASLTLNLIEGGDDTNSVYELLQKYNIVDENGEEIVVEEVTYGIDTYRRGVSVDHFEVQCTTKQEAYDYYRRIILPRDDHTSFNIYPIFTITSDEPLVTDDPVVVDEPQLDLDPVLPNPIRRKKSSA